MKKYNIAKIGSFDVQNFGDLLFPIVFEEKIKRMIDVDSIFLFSPNGGNMPFYDKKVYPIEELETIIKEHKIDAIIIGGGDLIRLDTVVTNDYDHNYDASIKIWLYPIIVGKKNNIPVLFNAPGVPYKFKENQKKLLKIILSSIDYLSVRDEYSKKILNTIGDFNCRVVPDTINYITKIYSKEDLKDNIKKLKKKRIISQENNYIVMQHKIDNWNNKEYVNEIKKLVDYITKKEEKDLYLVPIGYVHNDLLFLETIYDKDNKKIHLIREKLNPYDMLTIFANADGFIGTSLHGLLTSNIYNVPILAINTGSLVKVSGYLRLINKEELDVRDINKLLDIYNDKFYNQKEYKDKSVIKALEDHFNTISNKIKMQKSKKLDNIDLNILNDLVFYMNESTENIGLRKQLDQSLKELALIKTSNSWKITEPLRYIRKKVKIKDKNNICITRKSSVAKRVDGKIAVQVHIFYTDLLDEIYDNVKEIPYDYDLFISTQKEKKDEINKYFKEKNMCNVVIESFDNKGRDIFPFIEQMRKRINNYKYICHIHTKKRKYGDYGDEWRKYLYKHLLGNKKNIGAIFKELKKNNIGIVYPKTFSKIEDKMQIGSNKEKLDELCNRIGIKNTFNNIFPAGSMFWAKVDAIQQLFTKTKLNDFEEEKNQQDGTFAHAIERSIIVIANANGYKGIQTINEVEE